MTAACRRSPTNLTCCCSLLVLLTATICLLGISVSAQAAIISFVVDPINAANEVPCPQNFPGSGIGVLNLDDVTNVVIGKVIYSGLGTPETASHVHGPAAVCAAAGVAFPLPLGTPKNFTYTVTAARKIEMLNGQHYVNIHTNFAPGGQIRGQIVRNTLQTGACCLKGGTECLITDVQHCSAIGGTYQGDNTSCQGLQACCLATGCVMIDGICCDDLGGIAQGPGTSCNDPNICNCGPNPVNPGQCKTVPCPTAGDSCQPKCVNYNPANGQSTVLGCECGPDTQCHVAVPQPAPAACPPPLPRGSGNPCVVPNVAGTAVLPPPGCDYLSPNDVHKIIDGLPVGTTIILGAIHSKFSIQNQGPGGSLGGEFEQFASILTMDLCGTGQLAGFNRFVNMNVQCETHLAPRTPGDPVQSFDTDMFRLQGQLPAGDPDFDLLRITGGTAFGMPSPGHTTLTMLPGGNFAVDSFFDITYRIDFVGAPGGPLAGRSGSTTGTIRMATGVGPSCVGGCPPGQICEETRTTQADGTIDVCCNCVPIPCGPDPATPTQCLPAQCPVAGEQCVPHCARYNPQTGQSTVIDCQCHNPQECQVVIPVGAAPLQRGGGNPCTVPDTGGTVVLPPVGCDYLSPEQVHMIIDGLPAGTTIQLATIHKDFICHKQSGTPSVCSFPPPIPGVDCDEPGGSLGGEKECSDSTLQLNMSASCPGPLCGFNRLINLPASFETHTAPRTPGQPVQSFDTDMFRLFGQLPIGDPDFDLLRIVAGTDFGLPSPGHTTLTQMPGNQWAVDSFFDITYRIDFVGAPGGPLAGMSGSTTGTIRMATGAGPSCSGFCPPGTTCNESRTVNPDGTVDICCDCVPVVCGPDPAIPTQCLPVACPNTSQQCLPRCAIYNPQTGQSQVVDCECRGIDDCHVVIPGTPAAPNERGGGNPCTVPNVGGTVVLPPAGCAYLSPQEVHQIIDGLPPGTTIELAPIHQQFICRKTGGGVCSFQDIDCTQFGGSLGGEKECAESQLNFQAQGTGTLAGFNRPINIPASFETHVGPRTPGNPIQSFDTQMFRLFGLLPAGDPDFDLLRITAGNDFGMPSPGHTTLTQLPGGNWAVDSFFDITYRIDFVGHSPGPLGGMSGSTTGTIRMATGAGPSCAGNCPPGYTCVETRTVNADGTIEVCCDCVFLCVCKGDVSRNCVINGGDIQKFIDCLLKNPQPVPLGDPCDCADINGNGAVDMADVNLFVGLLLQIPKPQCPPNCIPAP